MVQSLLTAELQESISRHKVVIINCNNMVSSLVQGDRKETHRYGGFGREGK
jgi:hypothetical protein